MQLRITTNKLLLVSYYRKVITIFVGGLRDKNQSKLEVVKSFNDTLVKKDKVKDVRAMILHIGQNCRLFNSAKKF